MDVIGRIVVTVGDTLEDLALDKKMILMELAKAISTSYPKATELDVVMSQKDYRLLSNCVELDIPTALKEILEMIVPATTWTFGCHIGRKLWKLHLVKQFSQNMAQKVS